MGVDYYLFSVFFILTAYMYIKGKVGIPLEEEYLYFKQISILATKKYYWITCMDPVLMYKFIFD